jgi:transposase
LKTYSDEFKNSILVKLLPPNNVSVPQLVKETGIPRDTLYGWRRQAGGEASLPASPAAPVGTLSSAEKFGVVVETAILNELELGEYCRRKGLFAEQIAAWRATCRRANEALPSPAERTERRMAREQITSLTRELQRKDRALAEAAALLLLQKKSGRSGRSPRTLPVPRTARPGERLDRPGVRRGGAPRARLHGRWADPTDPAALAPGGRHHGRCTPPRAPGRGRGADPGQPPLGRRT